jgi:hypothetical protein
VIFLLLGSFRRGGPSPGAPGHFVCTVGST